MSLAAARLQADELRRQIAMGDNPNETKRSARRDAASRTFAALSERYLNEYARREKKSAYQDERNLRLHVLPAFGAREYSAIRRADVIEMIESIITAGTPTLANRVHSLISGIFSFAMDSDLIDANPCSRLRKRGVEKVGERVLSDPEIRLFWGVVMQSPISKEIGLALRCHY